MAHSQGTVLAAAALRQLASSGAAAAHRVALVTYGAPLTRLYRRAFPAYFGDGMLAELYDDIGVPDAGWRNFHRKTDLIGGRVFTGPDGGRSAADLCLLDPYTNWYAPGDPLPPVLGHSGYMRDPYMHGYAENLARQLLVEYLAGQLLVESEPEAPETSQDGEAKAQITSPPGDKDGVG